MGKSKFSLLDDIKANKGSHSGTRQWRTFTALTSDGAFDLNVGTYTKRSTFFAKELADASPARPPRGFNGIDVPDADRETFEYYKRCVEEGDAIIAYDTPAAENTTDEEAEAAADIIMMKYCKGYYLATRLGDCEAGILIIDALIDYTIETNCVLGNQHVIFMLERLSAGSGLYKLAVDMWAFAADFTKVEHSSAFRFVYASFAWDVFLTVRRAEAEGAGKMVEEAFDWGFIREKREKYHCFDESDFDEGDFCDDEITWTIGYEAKQMVI